jgi:hypothetical protein
VTKLPTGLELPEQENLVQSIEIAKEKLASLDAVTQAERAGCTIDGTMACLQLVGRPVRVHLGGDEAGLVVDGETRRPIGEKEQGLVLHYLVHGAGVVLPQGELIDFIQIPDAAFYGEPFRKRAEIPLERAFGDRAEDLIEAARPLGGKPVAIGDAAVEVQALPLVPVTLVMYEGDEEFPPKAKVLFRENVTSLLPTEDVAALSGMVIYPMVGMWKARTMG